MNTSEESKSRKKWRTSEQRQGKALRRYIAPQHRKYLKDAFNETNYPSDYSSSSSDESFDRPQPKQTKPPLYQKKHSKKHHQSYSQELERAMEARIRPAKSYREWERRTAKGEKHVPVTPEVALRNKWKLYGSLSPNQISL
ncbi:MAG: hypothetical protein MK137_07130 [Rickettsiales bacterium]|nr:hypothetical protein [Rickettsiales bacterium]